MFDQLLESSRRDDSNKWSNIEFGNEIKQVVWIEVNFYASSLSYVHLNRSACGLVWHKTEVTGNYFTWSYTSYTEPSTYYFVGAGFFMKSRNRPLNKTHQTKLFKKNLLLNKKVHHCCEMVQVYSL